MCKPKYREYTLDHWWKPMHAAATIQAHCIVQLVSSMYCTQKYSIGTINRDTLLHKHFLIIVIHKVCVCRQKVYRN